MNPQLHLYHRWQTHLHKTERPETWQAYATNNDRQPFATHNDHVYAPHETYRIALSPKRSLKRYRARLLLAHEYRHCEGVTHPRGDTDGHIAGLIHALRVARLGLDAYADDLRWFPWPRSSYRAAMRWLRTVEPIIEDTPLGAPSRSPLSSLSDK